MRRGDFSSKISPKSLSVCFKLSYHPQLCIMSILIVFGADPVRVLFGKDVCVTFSCVLELVGGMKPDLCARL